MTPSTLRLSVLSGLRGLFHARIVPTMVLEGENIMFFKMNDPAASCRVIHFALYVIEQGFSQVPQSPKAPWVTPAIDHRMMHLGEGVFEFVPDF